MCVSLEAGLQVLLSPQLSFPIHLLTIQQGKRKKKGSVGQKEREEFLAYQQIA